ncbi:uncharacterized protein LOC143373151 [Andrena cerasifolii]|uniref:uncharacterized protein LOC143373151 n=1 Tax=Andrena cerasifolii TaxID=2819439 RepID=UPI004037D207
MSLVNNATFATGSDPVDETNSHASNAAPTVSAMTPVVNRVSIRVPPFWPEQPGVWFHQIEAQFAINGVTADTTKFYYVMSQLESKYALEVKDIFDSPPTTDKYGTLKRELVRRLSASQSARIRQLLEQEEIGDRTPSQFLRRMRDLAGTTVSDDFLRTLWASRLPAMTRAIVTAQTDLGLNKLAEIGDQIHEGTGRTQVASVAPDTVSDALLRRLESMELRIAELSRARPRDRFDGGPRRRSGSRGGRRSLSPAAKEHCWYHRVFGDKAAKCRPGCKYSAGNEKNRH